MPPEKCNSKLEKSFSAFFFHYDEPEDVGKREDRGCHETLALVALNHLDSDCFIIKQSSQGKKPHEQLVHANLKREIPFFFEVIEKRLMSYIRFENYKHISESQINYVHFMYVITCINIIYLKSLMQDQIKNCMPVRLLKLKSRCLGFF